MQISIGQLIAALGAIVAMLATIVGFFWWIISGRIALAIREVEANVAQKMAETIQGVQSTNATSIREVTRSMGEVDHKLRETVQTVQSSVGTMQTSVAEAMTAMRVQVAALYAERKGDVELFNSVCGRLRTDLDECRRDTARELRALRGVVGSGKVFDAADLE